MRLTLVISLAAALVAIAPTGLEPNTARLLSEGAGAGNSSSTDGDTSSSWTWDWGWRTWSAFGACSICAIVAGLSIYISFLPASLISIDGKNGAAAINMQPAFGISATAQAVLARRQGEGLRNLTPRLLRPVRRDLKSFIEQTLDDASQKVPGDSLIFE